MTPSLSFRLRYSPFLAQMVVIRRCNLACGYCSEFDKTSDPVPFDLLVQRLEKLKQLGTLPFPDSELTPEAHARLFATDLPRVAKLIESSGIKASEAK